MSRKRRRSDTEEIDTSDAPAKNRRFGLDIRADPLPLITDADVRPQPGVAFRYKCPAPDCRRRSVSTQWLLTHLHENHGYHRYDVQTVYQQYFDEVDRRRLLWSLQHFSVPRPLDLSPDRSSPDAGQQSAPVSAARHAARRPTTDDQRHSSRQTVKPDRLPEFVPVRSDRAPERPPTTTAHRSGRYFHHQSATPTDSEPCSHTPSLQRVHRRLSDNSELSTLQDCFPPMQVAPTVDWSLLPDDLSWEARYGADGVMPFGFFRFPGETILRRCTDAMTDRERAAGRFLYDDISHFRRRYPAHTNIRRFVEREHAAHLHPKQRSPTAEDDDCRPYWYVGPWCQTCSCHHLATERCLPLLTGRQTSDDTWTIPSAAVADQPSTAAAAAAATSNNSRSVVFRDQLHHHRLNPPPAVAASLSLESEAATSATSPPPQVDPCTLRKEAASSEEAEVTSSPSVASGSNRSTVSLFAEDLTEPLDSVLATLHAEGKMPPFADILTTVSSFLRDNNDKLTCDLHSYVCSTFPPAQRLLAETVALSVRKLVYDTAKLQDVVLRQRVELANRDRRINELQGQLQLSLRESAETDCLDINVSDRDFD